MSPKSTVRASVPRFTTNSSEPSPVAAGAKARSVGLLSRGRPAGPSPSVSALWMSSETASRPSAGTQVPAGEDEAPAARASAPSPSSSAPP